MSTRLPAFFLIAIIFFVLAACIVAPAHARHAAEEHEEEHLHEEPAGSSVPDSGDDFALMVKIPAGTFKRGSTFEELKQFLDMCRVKDKNCELWWFEDEFPANLIYLDTYWIDIYEVSNEKYLEFVKATGHSPALDDSCETEKCRQGNLWKGASFPPRIRNQPVTQVSWYDADAYCRWRGKRLPSEAEWEKAARGPSGNIYPWGNGSPKGRATFGRKWRGVFTMTDVGSYPHGASIYGALDMAGNVWEWVDDWYHMKYYSIGRKKNPRGPSTGEFKVVRGGSWVNFADSLRSPFRRWSRPEVRFNDTGFRCARDAADEAK